MADDEQIVSPPEKKPDAPDAKAMAAYANDVETVLTAQAIIERVNKGLV